MQKVSQDTEEIVLDPPPITELSTALDKERSVIQSKSHWSNYSKENSIANYHRFLGPVPEFNDWRGGEGK